MLNKTALFTALVAAASVCPCLAADDEVKTMVYPPGKNPPKTNPPVDEPLGEVEIGTPLGDIREIGRKLERIDEAASKIDGLEEFANEYEPIDISPIQSGVANVQSNQIALSSQISEVGKEIDGIKTLIESKSTAITTDSCDKIDGLNKAICEKLDALSESVGKINESTEEIIRLETKTKKPSAISVANVVVSSATALGVLISFVINVLTVVGLSSLKKRKSNRS